jgi:hypothetical protein
VADVPCRRPNRITHIARDLSRASLDLVARNLERRSQPIESAGKLQERLVTVLPDALDDLRDPTLDVAIALGTAIDEACNGACVGRRDDPH